MASEKQIAANRANAKKSTGPKSKQGKHVVSTNALRHGYRSRLEVLPHENPGEYQELLIELEKQYGPRPGVETELVHRIAQLLWRLRRSAGVENGIYIADEPAYLRSILNGLNDTMLLASRFDPPDSPEKTAPGARAEEKDSGGRPEPKMCDIVEAQIKGSLGWIDEVHPGSLRVAHAQAHLAALAAYEGQIQRQLEKAMKMLETLQRGRRAQEEEAAAKVQGAVEPDAGFPGGDGANRRA